MSDLIRKQEVIDIMYEVFGKYSVANDKQDVLGGFGLEMFRRVKELPTAYDLEEVLAELEVDTVNVDAIIGRRIVNVKMINADRAINIAKTGGTDGKIDRCR